MTRQEAIDKQIEEIMDEFDFGLAYKIFVENGWTYHCKDIPTLGDLRRTARDLLRYVASKPDDGYTFSETGRFAAYCLEDTKQKWIRMSLMFTPVSWGIDEGDEYE